MQTNGDEATRFLNFIFQNCEDGSGNINLRHKDSDGKVKSEFVSVDHIDEIPRLLSTNEDSDWWYASALHSGLDGKKESVSRLTVLHLENDNVTPQINEELRSFLKPSAIIQSSLPTKQHFYWKFKEPLSSDQIEAVEAINKRLSRRFGGDPGTHDVTHVLRIPGTYNMKPEYRDNGNPPPEVKILELNPECEYCLEDFDSILPPIQEASSVNEIELKASSDDWERALKEISRYPRIIQHWLTPKPEDRSGHDFRLCCLCVEAGIKDPNLLYAILLQNPHGKCVSRREPDKYAQDLISKCLAGAQTLTSPEILGLSYLNLNLPSSLEISQMEIRVEWIVDNLIPKESISLLHSIGGVGKSYLMFGMGQAVADGKPFFGLNVRKSNVYYIDFENPLAEIADRMKKIGGSENMRIWHLGHNPAPIRFDADEWEVYKSFPPGFFIVDSLRSSHLLEENSSKDASLIMARHKEIRSLGHTILLIHHENKVGGYRGSTAWFDLSDHILKFSRVKKIGSDEDASEEDFDLPIRLGLGGKSRFSSAMDLNPMFFRFKDHQLCSADDPDDEPLTKMADLLNPAYPPNQAEFQKLVKENLGIGKDKFRKLLGMGEKRGMWVPKKAETGNKLEYRKG